MKEKIAFALMMGLITIGMIWFTLISINIGYRQHFLKIWFRFRSLAYLLVIPVLELTGAPAQTRVNYLFRKKDIL